MTSVENQASGNEGGGLMEKAGTAAPTPHTVWVGGCVCFYWKLSAEELDPRSLWFNFFEFSLSIFTTGAGNDADLTRR